MYKTLIEQASKLKSLQPILIAAGVIYTFNIWQARTKAAHIQLGKEGSH
jgi:hypothetical protein